MIDDEYEKIKREIIFEKAAKAIKEDPKNWIKQLEDIGFEYFDDDYDISSGDSIRLIP